MKFLNIQDHQKWLDILDQLKANARVMSIAKHIITNNGVVRAKEISYNELMAKGYIRRKKGKYYLVTNINTQTRSNYLD